MERKNLKNKISTIAQGQAGVYRVVSELMLRGMRPCIPASDDHGVDLVLESGIRIQVKSVHYSAQKEASTFAYRFNLEAQRQARTGEYLRGKRNFSNACDFVVLWGITEDRFWIVPAQILDGATGLSIGSKPLYRDVDLDEVRRLMEAGHSQNSIAKNLKMDQSTLSRKLAGQYATPKLVLARNVRPFEDAWEVVRDADLARQQPSQGQLIEMPSVQSKAS